MIKLLKIFVALCLAIPALAAVDFFLLESSMLRHIPGNPVSVYWPLEQKRYESEKLLRHHYTESRPFTSSGWSLRNVGIGEDGNLMVIAEFPPRSAGVGYIAPIYNELVRYCPTAGFDPYWNEPFAQAYTIFLAKQGKGGARVIARCTRAQDSAWFERRIRGENAGTELLVLPREGEEYAALEAAADTGRPSFREARSALNSNDMARLQRYLNERPELVDLYDGEGSTLLFAAESAQEAKILIGYGAYPNIQMLNGPTLLGWISQLGRTDIAIMEALIDNGAEARHVAAEYALNGKRAKLLLENGAPIRDNALFEAIDNKKLDVAQVLYERGARLDTTTLANPLHYFARETKSNLSNSWQQQLRKFRAAVNYGADLERREDNLTILEYLQTLSDFQGRDEIIQIIRTKMAEQTSPLSG